MKLYHLLFVLLFSCSKPEHFTPAAYIDKLDLFIDVTSVIGQSNAGGTIYTKVVEPSKGVNIMAYNTPASNEFQVLQRGVNTSYRANLYGIQSILGDSLTKFRNKDVYMFQPAYGGTAIIHWAEGGKMWKYIQQSIPTIKNFAQSKNKSATFKYTVWYQGEADAVNAKWDSATYRMALESFIERYRAIIGYDTKFIIIQFPDSYKAVPVENLKQIQDVQYKVGNQRNNVLITKDPNDKCVADGIHLTKESYVNKAGKIFNLVR